MPAISEEERRRRQENADCVIGTNALSGIELDAATHEIIRRYVCGDLTIEQLSSEINAHVQTLAAAYRERTRAATTASLLP